MKNNNGTTSGGFGLASVLTIVFIVLKLVGVINWSWVWVLAPLWIDLILTVIVIVGLAIYLAHDKKKYSPKKDKYGKWKF